MKRKTIITWSVVAVALVLLVAGFVGQALLSGITNQIVQRLVVPHMSGRLGLDVQVEGAGIRLIGMGLRVRGLRIGNPPGFAEPDLLVVGNGLIRVLPKFGFLKVTPIVTVKVKDVEFNIIRSARGRLNLDRVLSAGASPARRRGEGGRRSKPLSEPCAKPCGLGRLIVKKVALQGTVRYIDHSAANAGTITVSADARASNLRNFGNPHRLTGRISVKAKGESDDGDSTLSIKGNLAPLVNPLALSYELKGRMESDDSAVIAMLLPDQDWTATSADIKLRVECRDGVYDEDSYIRLAVSGREKPTKAGKKGKRRKLKKEIPIRGTLMGTCVGMGTLLPDDMQAGADENLPLLNKREEQALEDVFQQIEAGLKGTE